MAMRPRGIVALLSFPLQVFLVGLIELVNLSRTADPEASFVPGHLTALAVSLFCVLLFGLPALVQCVTLRHREDLNLKPARIALVLYACEAPSLVLALISIARR